MGYVVLVDDNFHSQDEEERYRLGEFDDAEVAVEHCRKIVNEYLASALEPGMSANELWVSFRSFGEDPFIQSVDVPQVQFSAWGYARERCELLCGRQSEPADSNNSQGAS